MLNASEKIEPLDAELFAAVDRIAHDLGLPYFIAGATARDVVLGACFGIDTGEATLDVDFAFFLESWDEYDKLVTRLLNTGDFARDNAITHRLLFRDVRILDLIPFGGVESPVGRIAWPPDFALVMSTQGFHATYVRAVEVRVAPDLVVKFASPDGLMLLKLFAWQDRGREFGNQDAKDIALLLRTYLDVGNAERLYEQHEDLLESEHFDYMSAGARILGRDLGSWLPHETRIQLLEVLAAGLSGGDDSPLVRAMPLEDQSAARLLQCFETGLGEMVKKK